MVKPSDSQQFRTDLYAADVAKERRGIEMETGARVAGSIERAGQSVAERQERAAEREFRGTEAEKGREFQRELHGEEAARQQRQFDTQALLARQRAEAEAYFDQQRTQAYQAQVAMQAKQMQDNAVQRAAQAEYNMRRIQVEEAKQASLIRVAEMRAHIEGLRADTEAKKTMVDSGRLLLEQQKLEMERRNGGVSSAAAMEGLRSIVAAADASKGQLSPELAQQAESARSMLLTIGARAGGFTYDKPDPKPQDSGAVKLFGGALPENDVQSIADPVLKATASEIVEVAPWMKDVLEGLDQNGTLAPVLANVTETANVAYADRDKLDFLAALPEEEKHLALQRAVSEMLARSAEGAMVNGRFDANLFQTRFRARIESARRKRSAAPPPTAEQEAVDAKKAAAEAQKARRDSWARGPKY